MNALQAATETYYDKAATGFFCGVALRAYARVSAQLTPPILDLGCGDGRFGAMLLRFLGSKKQAIGVDLSARAIARAQADPALWAYYERFQVGDARDLPFKDEQFGTILSNGVLASLGDDLPQTLHEIHRVLKPGGQVVASMCTDRFSEGYWIRRALGHCRLTAAAGWYTAAMDARTQHQVYMSAGQWTRTFEESGLSVRQMVGFLPVEQVRAWSVLAWSPMRVNGLLKFAPRRTGRAVGGWAQRRLYARRVARCPVSVDPADAGYLLIRAEKSA